MSVVEKLNRYLGDLTVQRQDQDAPLPGDELNTHPACVHSVRTNRQKGYRNSVPPRDATGDAFELDDAAVLTPAVAGVASSAASSAVFAGVVALADLAGIPFQAVAGIEFLSVAEDLSLADDAGGCPQPSVLVNRSGLLPGQVPCRMLRRRPLWSCGGLWGPLVLMPREVVTRMGPRPTL